MKTGEIGRGAVAALLLLMLAPLAGATPTREESENPSQGRATPSEVALERARGLAFGFRVADIVGSGAAGDEADDASSGPPGLGGDVAMPGDVATTPATDLGGSPAAVPEPSAALLFAGGLVVAGAARRLRRC